MAKLLVELKDLLNKYSQDSASNTPDFILTKYILNSLDIFTTAIKERDAWFNFYFNTEIKTLGFSNEDGKEEPKTEFVKGDWLNIYLR